MNWSLLKIILFPSLILITCTSCMVGPNFHTPTPPNTSSYTAKPLPSRTVKITQAGLAGTAQQFIIGQNISDEWWQAFHNPALNQLINTGLANNPTLSAAKASLHAAEEALNVQIGNAYLPAFDATASGERERFLSSSFGGGHQSSLFNLYNANVNASYMLDIFGGLRRQTEALRAEVDYQQFEYQAARLGLTANIVTSVITMASLQTQIQTTTNLLHTEKKQLTLLKKQYHLGGISEADVLTQTTLVNQTEATLPTLEKNLAQTQHALAVLVGNYTNQPLPKLTLNHLTLPAKLPVSLPSQLVQQRPDVRAAIALLHAANAQIGVATANLFPQFNLTGLYGGESTIPATLFSSANRTWNIIGTISQPIFHGGALLAARRQAIALHDQAVAQYRQIVLSAFQNVADTLRAIETDARTFRAQYDAEAAARQSFRLNQQQYRLGGISYLVLLNAQQTYQSTQLAQIQALTTRYTDTAALFQALGGGWCHKE